MVTLKPTVELEFDKRELIPSCNIILILIE